MTTPVDEFDSTLALAATGILRDFNRAGVILAADVHVASRLTMLLAESNESVALACALVARAVRAGSICLDLTEVRDEVGDDGAELTWPALDEWLAALAASSLPRVHSTSRTLSCTSIATGEKRSKSSTTFVGGPAEPPQRSPMTQLFLQGLTDSFPVLRTSSSGRRQRLRLVNGRRF
jgi:hypothetical protein